MNTKNYITYVINLKKATKRWNNIKKQLETYNLNYKRIDGVLGKELTNDEISDNTSFLCKTLCTKPTIGCAMSHINVWKNIIDDKQEYSLVLEDDAELVDNFKDKLDYLINNKIPEDFDIVYLGCGGCCDINQEYSYIDRFLLLFNKTNTYKVINENVFVPEFPVGLHGYLISNNGAKYLYNKFNETKIQTHIDFQIAKNHLPDIKVYSVEPKLVFQEALPMDSNIASGFPFSINYILNKNNYSNKEIPISYKLSVPLLQICGLNINVYIIISIIIGITLGLYKIKYDRIIKSFMIFSMIELIISQGNINSIKGLLEIFIVLNISYTLIKRYNLK